MNRCGRCGKPVSGFSKSRRTVSWPSAGSSASTPNGSSGTQEQTRSNFHHLTGHDRYLRRRSCCEELPLESPRFIEAARLR